MFLETKNNMQNENTEVRPRMASVENEAQVQVKKSLPKNKRKWSRIFFALFFIAGVSYGAYYWWSQSPSLSGLSLYENTYHGVFLKNGDVYFGKLSNKESAFVSLTDAYYLKVSEGLQNTEDGRQVKVPDLKLIKIGSEFHKPTNAIDLERTGILFIQELESDSEVIKVIKTSQKK